MKTGGWIALGAGAVGLGLAVLYKMGKNVATPGYTEPVINDLPMGASPATVRKAEVAAEVLTQSNAQLMQLQADKAVMEQRTYQLENALNAALAQQSANGNADASTIEAQRQALAAQLAATEAALAAARATADAANQSLGKAQDDAVKEANRLADQAKADLQAVNDKAARDLEKAAQDWANSQLGGGSGAGSSGTSASAFLEAFSWSEKAWKDYKARKSSMALTDRKKFIENWWASIDSSEKAQPGFKDWVWANHASLLVEPENEYAAVVAELNKSTAPNLEPKWQEAAGWIELSWKQAYPTKTTDTARLQWFTDLDKELQSREAELPGFGGWFAQNRSSLVTAMNNERRKIVAATKPVNVAYSDTVMVEAMFVLTAAWEAFKKLPNDTAKKAAMQQFLAKIETPDGKKVWEFAKKNNAAFVALVEAEKNRLSTFGGSAASLVSKPTTTAAYQQDPKLVEGMFALGSAWAQYKKLPNDQAKAAAMQKFLAARLTADGKKLWEFARTTNAALVREIEAEATRISSLLPKTGGAIRTGSGQADQFSGLRYPGQRLDEYVAKAQQYRDAAKILRADNMQRANVNMRLTRMMGR
jgi:uncharacterized protein YjbJ (UPF0337 family)